MKLIWYLWIALTLALIALAVDKLHAEPTKHIENSLGSPEFFTNQWSYLLALPIDGEVLDGQYTSLRVSPFGTPELYDENLFLCGDVSEVLDGKVGPLVFVYRTQATRKYQGIACHELKAIFEVPTK